jgi:hypothetical protein
VSVFRGCFQDVVGEFSWWMSKMMMNEFGVYLSSLAEQRGFRLPALTVRAEQRPWPMISHATDLPVLATSISIFLLHHQLHKHG